MSSGAEAVRSTVVVAAPGVVQNSLILFLGEKICFRHVGGALFRGGTLLDVL